MKLQLGKRYRTRDGRATSRLEKISDPFWPFQAKVDGSIHVWTEEGDWSAAPKDPLDLVEEIKESEEKQDPRIDYDKMQKEFEETHNSFTYAWNESKYTKTEQEDGTIILQPKKKRKIWIEVYECYGVIRAEAHFSKEALDESIDYGKEEDETLLEVIEREYPINKE